MSRFKQIIEENADEQLEFLLERANDAENQDMPTRIKIATWVGDQRMKLLMQEQEAPPAPPKINIGFTTPEPKED